ncbi:glycosyltransferase family 2 protein [Algoriphagus lacus]|nr:glycosyltransferase family 2 protein [Algoriphagus lacus]
MNSPLVSIITATYNSSHLLKYAIQSVLDSYFQDWELIVVGDCCTDDTEELVRSFGDPRISFFNLEQNSGQQAKPNNFALERARGQYIAFLNQDDMFFTLHLRECVAEIQISEADFLIVPGLEILPSKKENLEEGKIEAQLCSVHPDGNFSANVFSVASTWFFKRSLVDRLGPWKMEKDLYVTPSQEWLFRAWKSGIKFHFPARCGILVIISGARKGSYKMNSSFEHEFFYQRLNDHALKSKLYERAAIFVSKKLHKELFFDPKLLIKRLGGYQLDWFLKKLGIHPTAVRFRFAWGKKGGLIEYARKNSGL